MKVYIEKGETIKSLQEKGLSRTTAWRTLKRGWYVEGYHQRIQPGVSLKGFDIDQAYKKAEAAYSRHFSQYSAWKDDFVQEAVIRCMELSGKSCDPDFQFVVARNTMRDFAKWIRKRESPRNIESLGLSELQTFLD